MKKHGLFLTSLDIAEKIFSVPVEEREALLLKMAQERQAAFLGNTEKEAPEIATYLIKRGIRAKSYVKGAGSKNPLTKVPKSDKL